MDNPASQCSATTRRRVLRAGMLATAAALLPGTASADTLTDLKSRISQAQRAMQDLASRRQGQQGVVESLRGVTGEQAAELRRVDQELLATVSNLRQAESDLARTEEEIQSLERQIETKRGAVEQRAAIYRTRLRALYKFTRTSPLEQLLAATDFGDALRRITMMQAVTRVDNHLLGQLRVEQTALAQAMTDLAQRQSDAVSLRDQIEQQRKLLESRRQDQASAVAKAQQQQRRAEAQLSEFEQQVKQEAASVVQLQVQFQSALEELERQRVLLEQQRAAQATATAQAQIQATATAQAQATARAQATATAQARPPGQATPTPPAGAAATATAAAIASRSPATPVAVSGSVQTSNLPPSPSGLVWPVSNPVVTTEYGEPNPAQSFHTGIDLAVRTGTPVIAASDGIVMKVGLHVPGKPALSYGMMVIVGHSTTVSTLYAHLDDAKKPPVKVGDRVQRGTVLGYVGMTGFTTGPHLHFEVQVSGSHKNPRLSLPRA